MTKLIVNNCNNCPFCIRNYDEYSTSYNILYECNLSKFDNNPEYIILATNSFKDELVAPKWCPLYESSLEIEIKKE